MNTSTLRLSVCLAHVNALGTLLDHHPVWVPRIAPISPLATASTPHSLTSLFHHSTRSSQFGHSSFSRAQDGEIRSPAGGGAGRQLQLLRGFCCEAPGRGIPGIQVQVARTWAWASQPSQLAAQARVAQARVAQLLVAQLPSSSGIACLRHSSLHAFDPNLLSTSACLRVAPIHAFHPYLLSTLAHLLSTISHLLSVPCLQVSPCRWILGAALISHLRWSLFSCPFASILLFDAMLMFVINLFMSIWFNFVVGSAMLTLWSLFWCTFSSILWLDLPCSCSVPICFNFEVGFIADVVTIRSISWWFNAIVCRFWRWGDWRVWNNLVQCHELSWVVMTYKANTVVIVLQLDLDSFCGTSGSVRICIRKVNYFLEDWMLGYLIDCVWACEAVSVGIAASCTWNLI